LFVGAQLCHRSGFNVSNLMGLKRRRMIDIGKKVTFYFLQKILKVYSFFAFAKFAKIVIVTQANFIVKNINMGIKKTQNCMYADFKFVDADLNKSP
jgi:hypothetical protein